MRLAATISEHPIAAHAVGECVGDILERGGDAPDLLIVLVSAPLLGAMEDIITAASSLLRPNVLLSFPADAMTVGVKSSANGIAVGMLGLWHAQPSSGPGQVAIEPEWQARVSGRTVGVRLGADASPEMFAGAAGTLLLFADPHSVVTARLAESLAAVAPELAVIVASVGPVGGPWGARLVLDEATYGDGAVGVLLPKSIGSVLTSAFGFSPIGTKLALGETAEFPDGVRLSELGGLPARQALQTALGGLSPAERTSAAKALYLRWIDSSDAAVSAAPVSAVVLGTDGDALVVSRRPPIWADSAQLQVRDDESRDSDLRRWLAARAPAVGGLYLAVDRPQGSDHRRRVAASQGSAAAGSRRADLLREIAEVVGEEVDRADFIGLGCTDVVLVERGEVIPASDGVTVLGLLG